MAVFRVNRRTLPPRSSKVAQGNRLGTIGSSCTAQKEGDYGLVDANTISVCPPTALAPMLLNAAQYPYKLHPDGTITIKAVITVSNSFGTWQGRLRRGFWVEIGSRRFQKRFKESDFARYASASGQPNNSFS